MVELDYTLFTFFFNIFIVIKIRETCQDCQWLQLYTKKGLGGTKLWVTWRLSCVPGMMVEAED